MWFTACRFVSTLGLSTLNARPQSGAWLTNNTLSLPRDLTLGGNSTHRIVSQAFVPELATLRRAHTRVQNLALSSGSADAAQYMPVSAFGPQLEIVATFRFPSAAAGGAGGAAAGAGAAATGTASSQFGLVVLASNASSNGPAERTVIRFDLARNMVQLDRRLSGAALDADVRAGPWPTRSVQRLSKTSVKEVATDGADGTSADEPREVRVHVYVDHTVVSLIAGNETAISAWVAPQRAESVGVGVFSELGAGQVTASVDVWQLATPVH
jgi:hypothetical protein